MKNILRLLGGLSFVFGVIILAYSLLKFTKSEKEGRLEIDMGEGIVMVEENESEKLGNISLVMGAASIALGVVLFLGSGRK